MLADALLCTTRISPFERMPLIRANKFCILFASQYVCTVSIESSKICLTVNEAYVLPVPYVPLIHKELSLVAEPFSKVSTTEVNMFLKFSCG